MSVFSFSAQNVSFAVPAHPEGMFCASKQAQLTEIVDVEDAADGAARPAVLDLALCRRARGVVDGRIDLAEGLGDFDGCRHGWMGWLE
jgi:hypothetical protein